MIKPLVSLAAALALAAPALAQEEPKGEPSPNEIVAAAPQSDWVAIPQEDLLVMTLAPDVEGNERKVVIQLMPAPFSQGWVSNIRTLARAGWYDNISVNRVQDNYVVQWGDPNYDNPEATGEPKLLPEGLQVMEESGYTVDTQTMFDALGLADKPLRRLLNRDPYGLGSFALGWPVGLREAVGPDGDLADDLGSPLATGFAAAHCYGMVGVGRGYSPDTGSGAELYTVIGHAPRHLDRNIALVGRVIEGMEHLSSLPRGKGDLGFYAEDEFDKRTPILTVRVASDLPAVEQPKFEYLSTESEPFARYADARANRRDPFFIVPAGGADICNIPVPVRRAASQ
ncbi:peptidylprolyl isomerase [Parerythrobacter lacustris]|uniref:Peptidylprolyl isomerase n=1 Tax=Parerythrobacter lacustris TaxID=2969984 RepID=A0ABT1XMZ7_9SPHN|nr:peptidylprolyl isomerase [Parerythrobacter lacustris]MCR2833035.1 peptidylprolyl isomerase [Parerythrobacter lacustris]